MAFRLFFGQEWMTIQTHRSSFSYFFIEPAWEEHIIRNINSHSRQLYMRRDPKHGWCCAYRAFCSALIMFNTQRTPRHAASWLPKGVGPWTQRNADGDSHLRNFYVQSVNPALRTWKFIYKFRHLSSRRSSRSSRIFGVVVALLLGIYTKAFPRVALDGKIVAGNAHAVVRRSLPCKCASHYTVRRTRWVCAHDCKRCSFIARGVQHRRGRCTAPPALV